MAIAHRFGVISEDAFRQAMSVVEEILGAIRVERWVYRDEEGLVYGRPAVAEVDVAIRDGEHILLELKSRVSKADIAELPPGRSPLHPRDTRQAPAHDNGQPRRP